MPTRVSADMPSDVGLHVRDIMSSHINTTTPQATLKQDAALFLEHQLRRVPLVDGGSLPGIVSTQDLIRALADV